MQTWEQEILLREQGREEGLAAGREEGRSEGLAVGRSEGRSIQLQESLRNLITNLHLTPEQAMDALEIAPEEREKYRELLKEQSVPH